MKKWMLHAALLAAALALAVPAALAQEWNATPMTEEEMRAVWQASFDRMGTTGTVDITSEEELRQLEKDYTARTGLERKEDLVISSLPGAHDMPYEQALAFAKRALMEKYGVDEAELDAMGVYPRFIDYVYTEDESEWEFYFSSLTHMDIGLDHAIPAWGEYFVTFTAQSGEVLLCVQYQPTVSRDEARALARQAALAASKMTEAEFDAYYREGDVCCFEGEICYTVLIYTKTADTPDGDNHVYQVRVDAESGEILSLEYTDGVG